MNSNKNYFIYFILILLLIPYITKAQILITEVMYNPKGNDADREWFEAINLGESIKVKTGKDGWRIFDGKSRILKGEDFIWDKNEIIIFAQNKNNFLNEHPNFKNKIIESSFYLKNKEGYIKLIDENKNILAEFKYSSNLGGNGNGYSLIYENGNIIEGKNYNGSPGIYPEPLAKTEQTFLQDTKYQDNNRNNNTTTSQPTQKTQEQIILNMTTSTTNEITEEVKNQNNTHTVQTIKEYTLLVTEFLPNLKGKDEGEFIEIYNYGNQELDLSNIFLVVGNKKAKLFGIINPKEYKAFYNNEIDFNIRNKGETIKLIDDKGNIIHVVSYVGKAKEGKSFSKDLDGSWKWTTPTPGKENLFKSENKDKSENKENNSFEYSDNLISLENSKDKLNENNNIDQFNQYNKAKIYDKNINILVIGFILALLFTIGVILFLK